MITKTCRACGDSFEVYPSRSDAKFCSRECYLGTEHNPNEENKKKVTCDECGNKIKKIPSLIKRVEHNFCDYNCSRSYFSGSNHPHWSGGSPQFMGENWESKRKKRLEIDNYTCQRCGSEERLQVHHKVPRILFEKWNKPISHSNKLSNLIVLCESCHMKVEHHGSEI